MKVFLAITECYGKVHSGCSDSILKNSLVLIHKGHTVTPLYNGDLYIDHSRNFCAKVFLDSDCDVMVFVDADLKFEEDAILTLIEHDKSIVAGAYRFKEDKEGYPVVLNYSRNNNCKDEATGLVYVDSAPTGLMKITRSALESMIAHYDLKPDSKGIIPFFDTGIRFRDSTEWWGEDSFFCRRWKDMGMNMYVEPRLMFTHTGTKDYTGSLHEYLMGRQVKNMDNVNSGIPGWMTDNELALLKYLSLRCKTVIEIGSWKGRSTKALLDGGATVYAIDHWNGTDSDNSLLAGFGLDVYNEFVKNVGSYKNLKVMKGDSADMVKRFRGKADLVFIDGGHQYAEVKADIERWLPHCGKIIAGHDWCDGYPGVSQAVTELIGEVTIIDTIWFKEI